MYDEFEIPVSKIRKGDRIFFNDEWRTVTESYSYMGYVEPNESRPFWQLRVAKTEQDWPWAEYPTYGMQPNDDFDCNGPEMVWPYDCTDEILFYEDKTVKMFSDNVEILDKDMQPIRWWVAVYEVDQCYGGPEEGGWWFDVGEVKQIIPALSFEEAEEIREAMYERWPSTGNSSSVVYQGGDYRVSICRNYPTNYPVKTPHYC